MFFLLRMGFWLGVMLLVLPLGLDSKGDGVSDKDRASIDALAALAAAGATVSDVGGFCGRQPEACQVGQQALQIVGERARNGVTALTGYMAQDKDAAPASTGTAVSPVGRNTLSAADRKPAWRAPGA